MCFPLYAEKYFTGPETCGYLPYNSASMLHPWYPIVICEFLFL
jgi:hypothetical protein